MKSNRLRLGVLVGAVAAGIIAPPVADIHAQAPVEPAATPAPRIEYTDRIIVKLRDPKTSGAARMSATQVRSLSTAAGVTLSHFRAMSGDAQVLKLPYRMTVAEAAQVAQQLSADPAVEHAEPDRILRPLLVPNDPQYANQWHYQRPGAPDNVAGGANLPGAWDLTTGSTNIVIAVLDTGLVPHADIDTNISDNSGRVAPGYDFVSAGPTGFFFANDGDGRDSDPTDPGDWATQAEVDDLNTPCTDVADSSWHGTHVAGTIGANGDNASGVAGINWVSKILPVRVLGKCGGFVSDTVDAIRWAAGLAVVGVPANTTPAKVLNISLGGAFPCGASPATQSAINDAFTAGAVVVVAAGNEFGDAANATPASCNNVITVTAIDRNGAKPGYANSGATVEIAAPGGRQTFANDPNGILSTLNTGTTSAASDAYVYYQGTSMAAPHVSGVVSLMLSANSSLTPSQVLTNLQATARAFPSGTVSDCNTSICGAGIVNAAAAVAAVGRLEPVPNPRSFPGTELTTTSSAQTVTLINSTPATVTFTNIAVSGNFAITGGTCTNNTVLTNPKDACTVTLTFTPPTLGTHTGNLTITSDAANSPTLIVPLSGSGTGPTVTVTATDAVAGETTSGAPANPGTFTLTRTGVTTTAQTVSYSMSGGATSGTDYAAVTGSVMIPAGPSPQTATVTITPTDDAVYEGDETIILTLGANAQYVIGGSGNATITLLENESPPPPPSSGGGGGGGGCFIATAAFGTPMANEVRYLRAFRNEYLLTNAVGRTLVSWYYKLSPPVAEFLRNHDGARALVRAALIPHVELSRALVSAETFDAQTADRP